MMLDSILIALFEVRMGVYQGITFLGSNGRRRGVCQDDVYCSTQKGSSSLLCLTFAEDSLT